MHQPRRVVAGVSGSIASLAALRCALAHARDVRATLHAVLAWTPPGSELGARTAAPPALVQVWTELASTRLLTAFDEALGGVPTDVEVRLDVRRGLPGPVLVGVADRPRDLLVIGAGRPGRWRRLLLAGSVGDYCTAWAPCPLLLAPAPPMARRPIGPLAGSR